MKNWILFLILIMVCDKNYAQVPPIDAYASGDNNPLREGVAVGININPKVLLILPLALIIGGPLK